ncbi:MAG: hypothetical protein Q8877_03305, partial [Sweet potato little leaf phytoplasma]|nr:hypothetical protein [Sweet potato little leaf phytoplasma]
IKLLVDKKILESYLLFNNLTNKFQNFFSIFFQLMKTLQELINGKKPSPIDMVRTSPINKCD